MTRPAWIHGLRARARVSDATHHGLQMAVAVLLAYLVPLGLGLHEQLWAVVTTLIVIRPNAGSTLEAGLDRVRGTSVGALCGVAGVWLEQHGAPALVITLTFMTVLGFLGAAVPGLRSMPIATLIILGAGAIPGHSPYAAAGLRVLQILIGVGAALLVTATTSRYRAHARVRAGCAAILRRVVKTLARLDAPRAKTALPFEAATSALRDGLTRLGNLAVAADKAAGFTFKKTRVPQRHAHANIVAATTQVTQDLAVLKRALIAASEITPGVFGPLVAATSEAVESCANFLEGKAAFDLSPLEAIALADSASLPTPVAAMSLLQSPLQFLLEDLQALARVGRPTKAAPMPEPDTSAGLPGSQGHP